MKSLSIAAIAGLGLLGGCLDDYMGPPPPPPAAVDSYDAWYDGYYGPIQDGYWDGDSFYYRDYEGGRWLRDRGHHFRHDSAPGFRRIQVRSRESRPDR